MRALQAVLVSVMFGMWVRSAYKWFGGVQVSPPYYFFSTTLSFIICVAVIIIEMSISNNHAKHTRRDDYGL